jgi:hypothetical protein
MIRLKLDMMLSLCAHCQQQQQQQYQRIEQFAVVQRENSLKQQQQRRCTLANACVCDAATGQR